MKIIALLFEYSFTLRNIFISVLAFCLFFYPCHSNSAGQKSTDSLQDALQNCVDNTVKAKLLYRLWNENLYKNNKSALHYALELFHLSVKMNSKPWLCRAYLYIGGCLRDDGDYLKALRFTIAANRLSRVINDSNVELSSLQQFANIYFNMDMFSEALEYNKKCLQIAEKIKDGEYLASTLCSMGASYMNLGMNDSALAALQKALVIYQKTDNNAELALVNANIGDVYKKWDSLQTAMRYYTEAMNISQKMENIEDKDNLVFIYYSMGEVSGKMRNHAQSMDYFEKALNLTEEISDSKRARREIFEKMSLAYEQAGDFKNAVTYRKLFEQLKDSLLNEQITRQLAEMQTRYESEKKDKKIKLLTKEKALQQAKENRLTIIIWSCIIVGILLFVIIILLYRAYIQKQKSNIELAVRVKQRTADLKEANDNLTAKICELAEKEGQLAQSNKELNTLLYRLSHDLRAPLVTVMGLVNVFQSTTDADTMKKTLEYIDLSVKKMDVLLLDLNAINMVRQAQLLIRPHPVTEAVEEIFKIYRMRPELAGVNLFQEIESGLIINTDTGIFHSVVQNLVDNAIKYRKLGISDPMVTVKARLHKNGVLLQVKDNGRGMKPEVSAKAFDLMYRGTDASSGSGLGLYIVKSSVEKLGGTIKIESAYGKGTMFEIFLPELKAETGVA